MLDSSFGPEISALLKDDTVEEVRVNTDGQLWAVQSGARVNTGVILSDAQRMMVINSVADIAGEEARDTNPSFPAELPESGYRFHAVIPPQVPHPTFVVRRKPTKVFELEQYVERGELSAEQLEVIAQAIDAHENILVVGGTASGKTTFTNALLRRIGRITGRILTIEDTRELIVMCDEWIPLRTVRKGREIVRDMASLLRDSLRLTPDRIIVGEVRGAEVVAMLDAWGTGHPGGVATVHANSDREALERIEDLMRQGRYEPVPRQIARTINLIIFLGFETYTDGAGVNRRRRRVLGMSRVKGVKPTELGHEYIFAEACAAKAA
ncbi:ATPase, T2SS/T4P/T4SS family (plasmid) [Dyella sp. BiH032]|uniref:ATPase, T2SS/T4P/T4SS family n=1 Tax=Dyella sp. BiH032 TaxID=3075430 RepID=UPI0028932C1F|nr:ATPase, T2SS/T4P/T4SS family [Dyella sp. BiH032]WNL48592.1 ATPase, T2SS/T4P/T4SS family [Dyella sp. BiH032]